MPLIIFEVTRYKLTTPIVSRNAYSHCITKNNLLFLKQRGKHLVYDLDTVDERYRSLVLTGVGERNTPERLLYEDYLGGYRCIAVTHVSTDGSIVLRGYPYTSEHAPFPRLSGYSKIIQKIRDHYPGV